MHDILRALIRIIDHACHERGHELDRMVILQVGSLEADHRIGCRVGFIERVVRKIRHLIEYMLRDSFRDSVRNTAGNIFLRIPVNEIPALLLHDRSLFLGHRPSHKV